MLCRKFGLIPIKFGFFTIFKVTPKSGQSPCTIVQGFWQISPKRKVENSAFLCCVASLR